MPLTEDKRKQLDDIVQKMIDNKESDDDIQFVVNDFKSVYEQAGEFEEGIIGKVVEGVKGAGEFVKGVVTKPKETGKGLLAGVESGLGGPSTLTSPLSPGRWEQMGKVPEKPEPIEVTTEQEKRAKGVGEFGTKMGLGLAASTVVPGGGFGATMAKGAITNIPFAAESFKKGGLKSGLTDVAVNTALDAVLFGTGKLVGKGMQKSGKEILLGEMKVEKKLAKKISKNFDKAKIQIANTVEKYKLNKVLGNYDKMAKQADNLFVQKVNKADELILEYAKKNPDKKIDVLDIFADLEKKVSKPDSGIVPGEFKGGRKVVQNILDDIVDEGIIPANGKVTLPELVELKRQLNKGNKLFRQGTEGIPADPVKAQMYEEAYMELVKKVDDLVPSAASLNREARDLKFITEAAETAASRIRNRNKIFGFSEVIVGGGGGIAAVSNPDRALEIIALSSFLIGGKKALSQGRGAAALIKTGSTLRRGIGPKTFTATSGASGKIAEIMREEEEEKKKVRSRQRGVMIP